MTQNFALIKQYLTIETNYALIINGKYGIGKTHYFKKILTPKIKEVPTPHNASKKYFPIHISLFGLKNVEEIHTAIFMEIFPFLNNAGIKFGANVFKLIVRGAAAIKGINIEDNFFKDLNSENFKSIDYDRLVICFDDLDRKSEDLKLNDVFGFINALVENEGTKIMIITNDQELINESKEIYEKVKEKVVGVSIEFEQEIEQVFYSIIESKYSVEKVYQDFLNINSHEILQVLKDNDNNLRTLIFFLEHFRLIYSSLECEFQENPKFQWKKEQKIDAVLNFCLAIIFEYKAGRLNSSNFNKILDLKDNVWATLGFKKLLNNSLSENTNEPISYIEEFRKKYFTKKNFYYFESILMFLIGKKSFCIEALKKELIDYFGEEKDEHPSQNDVMTKLGYMNCFSLSDADYKRTTLQMLQIAYKGNYPINVYCTVFHFATRFDNMLNLDISRLKSKLKNSIKKSAITTSYLHNIERLIHFSNGTEFIEDILEIRAYCIGINDLIKDRLQNEKIENLSFLVETKFMKIIDDSQHPDSDFYDKPFWHKLNFEKVVRQIKRLENLEIWRLSDYFGERYNKHLIQRLLHEKDFILRLNEYLELEIDKGKKKSLKMVSLDRLKETIEICHKLLSELN